MSKFILDTTNFTQISCKKSIILDFDPPLKKVHFFYFASPTYIFEPLAMSSGIFKCIYGHRVYCTQLITELEMLSDWEQTICFQHYNVQKIPVL